MKLKTKKAAAKRFKITASGKILRNRQMKNHLKSNKGASALSRYKKTALVSNSEKTRIERLLPYEG